MRIAILGVNGQDGGFLAQSFANRGHATLGIGRGTGSRWIAESPLFKYRQVDLAVKGALGSCLEDFIPDAVFHVAAVHGAATDGFKYEANWHEMILVNVLSLHAALEYARLKNPSTKVFYAGSSKVYPNPLSGVIDETTPMRATCLYGIGKLASRDLLHQYRQRHGIATTNLIMFNHESRRRGQQYFLPKIARALHNAKCGVVNRTPINSLDFNIDWSSAEELMELLATLVEAPDIDELTVASGNTLNARSFVEELFRRDGFAVSDLLAEAIPPADPGPKFQVNIDRLIFACGRRPSKTAFDIVDDIMNSYQEQDRSYAD